MTQIIKALQFVRAIYIRLFPLQRASIDGWWQWMSYSEKHPVELEVHHIHTKRRQLFWVLHVGFTYDFMYDMLII